MESTHARTPLNYIILSYTHPGCREFNNTRPLNESTAAYRAF
jgi:hypothetical protein